MTLAPGSTLGPYTIRAELGHGGMGVVYTAQDPRLKRQVAIKLLTPDLTRDETAKQRFLQEAQAASALDHPNILTIHEINETPDGQLYLVMAYYEGETLKERIERGPLAIDDAIDIATQVGRGLSKAHAAGIVHRDIKPANLIVTADGTVKILDFGLAKLAGAEGVTQTGTTVGTVAYMSPEQARGQEVDHRTDIWSLGVVLYEMLTGQQPFRGENLLAISNAILGSEPVSLTRLRAGTSPALARVVTRSLANSRDGRYQSVADLLDELRNATAPTTPATRQSDVPSIAVLPFANMSADPENEYFCDGIAEEITSALSKVGQLQVAGRTSAFSFKGKTGDLREIGRTLNVGAVLEGSVRKSGSRLRIIAQLVKVADGYHLWSERYDRQMDDVFEIQDEIALAVVEALKVTLLGGEKAAVLKRSTENAEAYQLCLKATHAWARWTDEGFRTAMKLFEQALEHDPNYAMARFGLGDIHASWAMLGRQPPDLVKMRAELEAAIRLDPGLADAHAVLGLVETLFEWNWASAESRFQTAVALDPRSAHVCNVYGAFLGIVGRCDEALATYRRAIELDPLGPLWNACFAQALLGARDWDGALRQAGATLDLAPDYWFALQIAGQASVASGDLAGAVASFERAVTASAEGPHVVGLLGNALARAGRRDEALQQLAVLQARAESHYVPALAMAFIHAGLDQWDEAFALIERAREVHDPWLIQSLTINATLDSLRPDPRLHALLRRMNFPETASSG